MKRYTIILIISFLSISTVFSQSSKRIIRVFEFTHKKKIKIDTTFIIENNIYRVTVNHFRTKNKVFVPIVFIKNYGLNSYVYFDYQTNIKFFKNGKFIKSNWISKKKIDSKVDESLSKWGILYFPYIEIEGELVIMNYSLTIPLTDIGELVSIRFNKAGLVLNP